MKKNSIKYMLGIALIGVWGLVGFRFYEKMNQKNNYSSNYQITDYSMPEPNSRSFDLSLDYKDPFLGKPFKKPKPTFVRQENPVSKRKPTSLKSIIPKEKRINFPSIIYKGNIRTEEGRDVALMDINGQFIQLRKLNSHNDLKLLHVYQDSIRVGYLGKEKTIKKIR